MAEGSAGRGSRFANLAAAVRRGRRPGAAIVVATALFGAFLPLVAALSSGPASAATSAASTLTKSGTDPTTASTATAGGAAGTTRPGDTINWVVPYTNNTGATGDGEPQGPDHRLPDVRAGVTEDPPEPVAAIFDRRRRRPGRRHAAGQRQWGGATGTVPPNSQSAQSPNFVAAALNFTTPGGDGYSVEGQSGNIYTVFHHSGPAFGNADRRRVLRHLGGGGMPGMAGPLDVREPHRGYPHRYRRTRGVHRPRARTGRSSPTATSTGRSRAQSRPEGSTPWVCSA